jgi:hypothetical protein
VENIILSFPPYLDQGVAQEFIYVGDHLLIEGSDTTSINRILSLSPFTVGNNYFSGAAALSVGAPIIAVDGNGATIVSEILRLALADQTHPGILSATPQDIGGEKTFHANVNIQDPPNGLTISKTVGDFGVQLLTSDANATPGFAIGDTAFPSNIMGLVYKRTGFISANPEMYLLSGNNAGIIFDDTDGTVTITNNTLTNFLDARAGQVLSIGGTNATVINLGTNTTLPFDKELAVNQIDSVTAAPLIIGATNTTEVQLNKGVKFATAGGTPALLNDYEEYDHVTTFTNNLETTAAITLKLVRIGNAIILRNTVIASVAGQVAPVASFTSNTPLPARFRPAVSCQGDFRVSNNSVYTVGAIEIDSAGVISIYNDFDFTTAFTAAVTNGFYTSTFAYTFN